MRAKKILVYILLIKRYRQYGLRLTAVQSLVEYEPGKQLSEVPKIKGNSFCGKMIEDLACHKSTKCTREERDIDEALRSPFFDNLEEICAAYEIKKSK